MPKKKKTSEEDLLERMEEPEGLTIEEHKRNLKQGMELINAQTRQYEYRLPKKSAKDLGERLKELRRERGITQKDLAKKIGIYQSNWSSYEKGRQFPSIDVLLQISDFFGCNIEYLLGLSHMETIQQVSAYEFMRMLSNLLFFTNMDATLTDDDELVIKLSKEDRHYRMIKSIIERSIENHDWMRSMASYRNDLEANETYQREWLKEMRWQYGKYDLTCDRKKLYEE